MEGVEYWALQQSLQRDYQVLERKDEASIINHSTQTDPVVFEPYRVVVKVKFAVFVQEDGGLGSLNGEEHAGF